MAAFFARVLAVPLFLFVSLALMWQGWGSWRGLLGHPARAGFVAVLTLAFLGLLWFPLNLFAVGKRELRHQRWATFLALLAMGFLLWFLPYADRRGLFVFAERASLRYTGLALVLLGVWGRLGAMIQLGPFFSGFVTVQEDHQVIHAGFYRWIRHPIYACSLLALAGVFLVFRSQTLFFAFPLYLVGTLWRIADEERFLEETLGDAYRCYQRKTWRLIPWIY